jgi:ClpP class serine protease
MEESFLEQLLADRRELLDFARQLGTADAMRAMRADFMAEMQGRVNVTPAQGERASYRVVDNVAYIPIQGQLTPQAETDICGAYTADALTEYGYIIEASRQADADPEVESITYEINSPGGYVDGVMDASDAMRQVSKPTMAIVGSMAASAAYWLASQTDRIVASSPLSRVGSIGVAVEEYDTTKAMESAGITKRVYTSTDAPDKRPDTRTEEGQKKVIASLDDLHSIFARSVAEGRGVTVETVNSDYGRGGVLIAEKALDAGMIDQVWITAPRVNADTPVVDRSENNTAPEAGRLEEAAMDKQQLRNEHPDLYAEIVGEGQDVERARVARLMKAAESDPDNVKLQELVQESIISGDSYEEISDKINVAIRDGGKLDGENPPNVETTGNEFAGLSEEDREAIRLMDISPGEYRKLVKKEAE